MTRSKKLEPVVDHVKQKEESALQAVAFSQQQLQMQIGRLQQLQDYKQEYEDNHLSHQAIQRGRISGVQALSDAARPDHRTAKAGGGHGRA